MFENARLKVSRAKKHIENFHDVSSAFFEAGACEFVFVKDPKEGRSYFELRQHKSIPPDFALIIGDAVHNLRSALDQLIWELVSPHRPIKPERVQFPFAKKPEALESVIVGREIQLAGEKIVQVVRDAKPYPGRDGILYALHELDIADKHKIVLDVKRTLISAQGLENKRMEGHPEVARALAEMRNIAFTPNDDGKIGEVHYRPPLTRRERRKLGIQKSIRAKREEKVEAVFVCAFGDGQPLAGLPVTTSLVLLTKMVTGIIASSEKAVV